MHPGCARFRSVVPEPGSGVRVRRHARKGEELAARSAQAASGTCCGAAGAPAVDALTWLLRFRSRSAQKVHEHLVKLFGVQIDLYFHGLEIDFRFVVVAQAEDAAIARPAAQVHRSEEHTSEL